MLPFVSNLFFSINQTSILHASRRKSDTRGHTLDPRYHLNFYPLLRSFLAITPSAPPPGAYQNWD